MLRAGGRVWTLAVVLVALPLVVTPSAQAAPPFFAPVETSGSLQVKLYPTEGIGAGTQKLVTFGVPFPRGSVTVADLSKVRVLKGGVEIPAYVGQATPWRHATNASLDGTSVRVARIQVLHTLSVTYPSFETITVEWGQVARGQNVGTYTDPRSAWHLVTSGTYVASDNVYEPDVYAVLPVAHLAKGLLRPMRMDPLEPTVAEARVDPFVSVANWPQPRYLEQEHASVNFFYSIINQDDSRVTVANQNPYKTDSEPWLYDRASSIYTLYFRSGFFKALREAVRAAEFYRTQLYPAGTQPTAAVGAFRLKNPDPAGYIGSNGTMYSYDESLAYQYWLTGDPQALTAIPWIVNCHELSGDEPVRWSPGAGAWTERHNAFRLLASLVAYEVLGDATYKNNVTTYTGDFIWHQNGGGGAIPANRVDGGLYHYGDQHGDGTPDQFVASSWMSVLLQDAMVRAYAVTEDAVHRRLRSPHGHLLPGGHEDRHGSPLRHRRPALPRLHDALRRRQRRARRHRVRALPGGVLRGRLGRLLRRAHRPVQHRLPPEQRRPLRNLQVGRRLLDTPQRPRQRVHRLPRQPAQEVRLGVPHLGIPLLEPQRWDGAHFVLVRLQRLGDRGQLGHRERRLHRHAIPGRQRHGHRELRHVQRDRDGGQRLHRRFRHVDLRGRRDVQDRLGGGRRRHHGRRERDLLPEPERCHERHHRRGTGGGHDHR